MFFSDFVGEPIGRADPLDPALINACLVSLLRIRYAPDLSILYNTYAFFVKSITVSFFEKFTYPLLFYLVGVYCSTLSVYRFSFFFYRFSINLGYTYPKKSA